MKDVNQQDPGRKARAGTEAADRSSGADPAPAPQADFATADRLRSVRSRFRSSSHSKAHDDEAAEGRVADHASSGHPLIPRGAAPLVEHNQDLAALVEELRQPQPAFGEPAFAYDSEFIGESTYRPRLCVIQVATPAGVTLIDPMARGMDLAPFWALIGDESIRKIVHAGEQDLEPALRLGGVEPRNVTDTQVMAGFCALPYPSSLARLVEQFFGVRLGKGLTFTQWDQRPLSKKQLAYAADDVRFLPALAVALDECLAHNGLGEWARQECAWRASAARLGDAGEEPWERVRGGGALSGQQLAVLRELAVWREQVAREQDLPPRALLKDEVLIDLARRPPPADSQRLALVRHMPRPVAERYGGQILAAIARGREAEAMKTSARPPEPTLPERFTADAAWALVQTLAAARGIDANLLASRREIESFARRVSGGGVEAHPLMQGWRREAGGALLLALMRGEAQAQIEWSDGRPRLVGPRNDE